MIYLTNTVSACFLMYKMCSLCKTAVEVIEFKMNSVLW